MLLDLVRCDLVVKMVLDFLCKKLVRSRSYAILFFYNFKEVVLPEVRLKHIPDGLRSVHVSFMAT